MDEGPRADTSLEAFGEAQTRVSRARHNDGRKQLTDERRSGCIDRYEQRARQGAGRQAARALSWIATAGGAARNHGIGPAYAIPKVLKLTGLTLDQIDVIELNEAFAVQSLAVIKMLESILRA